MTAYPGGSLPACPPWCTRTAGHDGPCCGAGRETEGISVQAALLPADRTAPVVALTCDALTWPAVFLPPGQAAGVAVVLAALGHPDLALTITEVITEVTP